MAAMSLGTAVAAALDRTAPMGRECEFADAGGCTPTARRREGQQSARLLTLHGTGLNVGKGRLGQADSTDGHDEKDGERQCNSHQLNGSLSWEAI